MSIQLRRSAIALIQEAYATVATPRQAPAKRRCGADRTGGSTARPMTFHRDGRPGLGRLTRRPDRDGATA